MDMIKHIYKVTVIIPCFNRESYIRETIDSVLNQTYEPIEIIVIDDGSTDGSRDVLESYKDKIILLEHPGRVNRGQSAAINLGLDQSSGEYIAILDSDDLFLKDKIKIQVEFLDNNLDIGLVYSNGYYIDEHGNQIAKMYYSDPIENSDPERVLMDCYFLVPNNSLVRRSVYHQVGGFDEDLRAAQDHDMAIRIAEKTKLAYIDDYLFLYRRHPDSISAKKADLRWRNGFIILNKAVKRYNYSFKSRRKRFAVLNFRIGQCFLENNKYLKAFIHFLIAGLCDPVRSSKVLLKMEIISSPH